MSSNIGIKQTEINTRYNSLKLYTTLSSNQCKPVYTKCLYNIFM